MTTVYAIVMITGDEESLGFGIEPVGIYSSMEAAFEYVEKLEEHAPKIKGEYMFDIFEYKLDESPILLDFFKTQKQQQGINEEAIQDLIIELMKEGVLDQLVGEDGRFYYKLTEKGKKRSKEISKDIKKFFRDRDEE